MHSLRMLMSGRFWSLVAFLFLVLVVILVFIYGFADEKGYTSAGIALISSIVFPIILLLGLFLEELGDEWRITSNPWVKDVKEMDFWFNPMFYPWLYCHDRKRWAKWTLGSCLLLVFIFGSMIVWLFTLHWATLEALMTGFLVGAAFTTLMAVAYYQRVGND